MIGNVVLRRAAEKGRLWFAVPTIGAPTWHHANEEGAAQCRPTYRMVDLPRYLSSTRKPEGRVCVSCTRK